MLGELEPKDGKVRLLVKYSRVPGGVELDGTDATEALEEIDTSTF